MHDNGATGIQIEDGSENIVVENNLSENNAQKYEFEAGAWIDDSKNVVVRNNILRSNKVGLTITGSDRVIVHDNFLYFNNRGAENLDNAAGLIVEDSVTNISVTHNTFYKNGASGMERGAVNFGRLFNPAPASLSRITSSPKLQASWTCCKIHVRALCRISMIFQYTSSGDRVESESN